MKKIWTVFLVALFMASHVTPLTWAEEKAKEKSSVIEDKDIIEEMMAMEDDPHAYDDEDTPKKIVTEEGVTAVEEEPVSDEFLELFSEENMAEGALDDPDIGGAPDDFQGF